MARSIQPSDAKWHRRLCIRERMNVERESGRGSRGGVGALRAGERTGCRVTGTEGRAFRIDGALMGGEQQRGIRYVRKRCPLRAFSAGAR